jgi:hypothetical protein
MNSSAGSLSHRLKVSPYFTWSAVNTASRLKANFTSPCSPVNSSHGLIVSF